jgi:cation diffusion facilitator family transporter
VLSEWLVRRFLPGEGDVKDARVRAAHGKLEGWTSVVVNLLIFAVKLVPGLLIGSIALIADAFHSLGDVVSSGVVIWGFKVAAKPSDSEHPFGHGRFEAVTTLVIALMLLLTAWEFGRAALLRLLHPRAVEASLGLLVLLAVSLVLKEWLARFSLALGQRIGSSALVGDSWHHRSDVLATAVVIVALIASNLGVGWVDGAGGLVVAGFIAWAAVSLLREAVNPLIGEAPSPKVLEEMRAAALAVPRVEEVHDLTVHRYGSLAVTSLHIEVSAKLDITTGHETAEAVENKLTEKFGGSAVVHVDPVDRDHPLYPQVHSFLADKVARLAGGASYHDLRIVGSPSPCFVIFDLKANADASGMLADELREAVAAQFPAVAGVVVNVEPRYVY